MQPLSSHKKKQKVWMDQLGNIEIKDKNNTLQQKINGIIRKFQEIYTV